MTPHEVPNAQVENLRIQSVNQQSINHLSTVLRLSSPTSFNTPSTVGDTFPGSFCHLSFRIPLLLLVPDKKPQTLLDHSFLLFFPWQLLIVQISTYCLSSVSVGAWDLIEANPWNWPSQELCDRRELGIWERALMNVGVCLRDREKKEWERERENGDNWVQCWNLKTKEILHNLRVLI